MSLIFFTKLLSIRIHRCLQKFLMHAFIQLYIFFTRWQNFLTISLKFLNHKHYKMWVAPLKNNHTNLVFKLLARIDKRLSENGICLLGCHIDKSTFSTCFTVCKYVLFSNRRGMKNETFKITKICICTCIMWAKSSTIKIDWKDYMLADITRRWISDPNNYNIYHSNKNKTWMKAQLFNNGYVSHGGGLARRAFALQIFHFFFWLLCFFFAIGEASADVIVDERVFGQ